MPRCKSCKNKFEAVRFNQKFCLDAECVRVWVEFEKTKQWKEKKQKMQQELETIQDYVKMTQIIFNKFIRLRDKGQVCISCQKKLKEGNVDAGHMWSAGGHSNLRFNEFNVNAQCSRPCNKDKAGDINNYRLGFVERYGIEKLNEIDSLAKIERKFSKEELKELMQKYKLKCKELENKY
jgi:hypothetical protein